MKRVRVIVSGRVQGVGFRYFATEKANELQLTGMVRNLRNGGVEVIAEGEEGALEALVEDLKTGPISARVEQMHVVWQPYENEFTGFGISHDW